MSDLCTECLPDAAALAVLASRARGGEAVPCAGDGSPDTVIGCAHGEWRLGDVLPAPACTELTKAGEPCKGTPGPDGLCAAHKPKGDADAESAARAAGGADQAAGEAADAAAEGQAEGVRPEGGEDPGGEQEEGRG